MKKSYNIKTILTFAIIAFMSTQVNAQLRLTQINPATESVTIHNYGSSMVNISNYWICSRFSYAQFSGMTILNGSLALVPGADVTVTSTVSLNDTSADLGLYNTNSFGSTTAMEDFTQWGAGGIGRENVAVAKGIWTTGDFISVSPPYEYTGNGSQNGVAFWQTLLSIDDQTLRSFSIVENPVNQNLNISLSENIAEGQITIYDLLGKRVITEEINNSSNLSVNVSSLREGMYLITIESEQSKQTKRFIKN